MVGLMLYLTTGPGGHQQASALSTQPAGPSGRATARLDLSGLDAVVQALFSTSLTEAAYCTGSKRFLLFCETSYHPALSSLREGTVRFHHQSP